MGEARGHSNARCSPSNLSDHFGVHPRGFSPRGVPKSVNTGSTPGKEGESPLILSARVAAAWGDRSARGSAHADLARGRVLTTPQGAGCAQAGAAPRVRPTHGREPAPPAMIRSGPGKRKNLLPLSRSEQNGLHLVPALAARRARRTDQ